MIGLMIGRFQPLHRGHLESIKKMIIECDRSIIGIGSSQYGYTRRNPFTYDERVKMFPFDVRDNTTIIPIPDIHHWDAWIDHVIDCVGEVPDVIYSGSDITTKLFRDAGFPVRELKRNSGISATDIREMISKNDCSWVGKVDQLTFSRIHQFKGCERIDYLNKRGDRVGVDIHGVIDSAPHVIKQLLLMLRLMGMEVIIISGPPMKMIKKQLKDMGITKEKHYDRVYSIVEHLKETGCEMWQEDDMWHSSHEDWNRSKGEICEEEGIAFMIDDSVMYRNGMPDFTKFLLVKK